MLIAKFDEIFFMIFDCDFQFINWLWFWRVLGSWRNNFVLLSKHEKTYTNRVIKFLFSIALLTTYSCYFLKFLKIFIVMFIKFYIELICFNHKNSTPIKINFLLSTRFRSAICFVKSFLTNNSSRFENKQTWLSNRPF